MATKKKEEQHGKNYEKVKNFYDQGLWDEAKVRNAVTHPTSSPWITQEEYTEITGEVY